MKVNKNANLAKNTVKPVQILVLNVTLVQEILEIYCKTVSVSKGTLKSMGFANNALLNVKIVRMEI